MNVTIEAHQKIILHYPNGALEPAIRIIFFVGPHGPFFADIPERDYNIVSRLRAIEPVKRAVEKLVSEE